MFTVDFLRSEMSPQFILIFTKQNLIFDNIAIRDNLQISVGDEEEPDSYERISFKISPKSSSTTSVYIIEVSS